MRVVRSFLLCLAILAQGVSAQLKPEQPGVVTLPPPSDSWVLVKTFDGSYLFDGDTGEMQGLMSHQWYTPAVVTLLSRSEAYYVESFYSRGVRGERQDVVTVVDMTDLSPKAEIDIPDKAAALSFRHHIGLLGDDRHLVVFNMTPAQSVSIVDVVDREFVGEISTPGCAIIMPVEERAFLMLCGDGTLQYLQLDDDGNEAVRSRTKSFFEVDSDPVFDKPVLTDRGWLLVTFLGRVFEVTVEGVKVEVSKPWSLLSEADAAERWRPGGGQPFTVHRESGLLYALVHQGGEDSHHDPGSEVWIYDLDRRKRVGRMTLEVESAQILAGQQAQPRLYALHEDDALRIYDGLQLRLLRTIENPGPDKGRLLQTLARHD
jgi:methylamine dehydrogenase heavy chain